MPLKCLQNFFFAFFEVGEEWENDLFQNRKCLKIIEINFSSREDIQKMSTGFYFDWHDWDLYK